ncbi:7-cyano-7-deazaguanine reductase [Streptococcus pneumoniae]|nr:7-cyano-7-deazaguanine reductase [Streptococcus pneumoniae]
MKRQSALVVFSGGQDSTTCLFWAMQHYETVEAVTFAYGQRHHLEIQINREIAKEQGIRHHILDMSLLGQITAQPDFATIHISYIPDKLCVESKSLKLYLFSYRNHGDFHENCKITLPIDTIELIKPIAKPCSKRSAYKLLSHLKCLNCGKSSGTLLRI